MKKKLLVLAAMVIPVCLYLNVWQAFRYRMVENEVESLEDEQQLWLENNKKAIVGIEVLGAPSRINELASEMEDLEKPEILPAIRIEVASGEGDG
jgi:cell division protein FtsL